MCCKAKKMGGKVFIRYFRPNLTHATGQRSCYALGKGLTTNGSDVWTMFNPLPTQSRSRIHGHFFDTLAYHYTPRRHPFKGEKAVAQPFSLLHHQGPIPSNGVRRMSRPAHVLLLTISPSVTPPRILTPIFQPSWRIITGNFGCHFEPGSGSCL